MCECDEEGRYAAQLRDEAEEEERAIAESQEGEAESMSYSQNDEESHILRIVGDKPGRFLDIGAYNPKLFSNTRALFERGWSGVMVEPSPGPFLDLLIEYGKCHKIELINAAVGGVAVPAFTKFRSSEAGVGTSNAAHYQKWRDKAQFDGEYWVVIISLERIVNIFGNDFAFVNIDIEGESTNLFLEALRLRLRPKCYCVEHDGRQEELTLAALKAGYVREHLNGENVIFARQEGHDNA